MEALLALAWTLSLIGACLGGSMAFLGLMIARWWLAIGSALTCGACVGLCMNLMR